MIISRTWWSDVRVENIEVLRMTPILALMEDGGAIDWEGEPGDGADVEWGCKD